MAETCLLAIRRPVYRRRDSHPGSTAELENLDGDAKGKRCYGRRRREIVSIVADV